MKGGAIVRGIPGHDVVRHYAQQVPKMALDLALDGNAFAPAYARNSIVGMLVTAGATMTGNSSAMQSQVTPFRWRRHDGPAVFPKVTAGPKGSAHHQSALRRSDARQRIMDGADVAAPPGIDKQVVVVNAPEDVTFDRMM